MINGLFLDSWLMILFVLSEERRRSQNEHRVGQRDDVHSPPKDLTCINITSVLHGHVMITLRFPFSNSK